MKNMLIITGPQGSGNHLFSKCFALHEDVYGWQTLVDQVWEGHREEPFSNHWNNPEMLHDFNWDQSNYYVTSVSVPYVRNKVEVIPNFMKFAQVAQQYCNVQFAIIGRDQNILEHQQTRVRGRPTLQQALDSFHAVHFDCHYLSQELLYLYKENYLRQLSKQMRWPIAYLDPKLDTILADDSNKKYINKVDSHWLDDYVIKAIEES